MDNDLLLKCNFESTYENVSRHLEHVKCALDQNGVKTTCQEDVLIVLAEVLNNIVEHGYAEAADGEISLKVNLNKDSVRISTRDYGPPIPTNTLTASRLPDHGETLEDFAEGGFGWFMIHSLTHDMNYERMSGANLLTFSIAA